MDQTTYSGHSPINAVTARRSLRSGAATFATVQKPARPQLFSISSANELLWIADVSVQMLRRGSISSCSTDRDRAAAPAWGYHRGAKGGRHRTTVAAVSRLVARARRAVSVRRRTRPIYRVDARRARLHTVDGGAMGRTTRRFLRWSGRPAATGDLTAGDIDNYVANQGKGRWARVSTANMVSALRGFLRYAAKEGWCSDRWSTSICRPRLYQQEIAPICAGLVRRPANAGRR